MINYPNIDPVIFNAGPLSVRWYGLMYLVGIAIGWGLGSYRIKQGYNKLLNLTQEEFNDLILYIAFGLLIGGRIGFMLFYQTSTLFTRPWELIMLWRGGMAFHGGLIGAALGIALFCRQKKHNFFLLADFMAPLAPPAFFFGRLGNFINGELWGRVTDVPWAMIFPHAGPFPRHPSQLYEALLEGLVLFIILWVYTGNKNKLPPKMAATGLFILSYGVFRTIVEFYRVPDGNLGYLFLNWITMGQLLSFPMTLIGLVLLFMAYKSRSKTKNKKY